MTLPTHKALPIPQAMTLSELPKDCRFHYGGKVCWIIMPWKQDSHFLGQNFLCDWEGNGAGLSMAFLIPADCPVKPVNPIPATETQLLRQEIAELRKELALTKRLKKADKSLRRGKSRKAIP